MSGAAQRTMGWAGCAREAVRSLSAVRARSALALVGIAVGIGSVSAMVSTGQSVRAQAMKEFEALGADIVTAKTHYAPRLGKVVTFPPSAVRAIEAEIGEIAHAAGWSRANATLEHRGRSVRAAAVIGVIGSFAQVAQLRLARGRFVSDVDARQRYCAVGAEIARTLGDGDGARALGERIRLGDQIWTVIGVLEPAGQGRFQHPPDRSVYVALGAARRFNRQGAVGDVIARTAEGATSERAAAALRAYLEGTAPGIEVRVRTAEALIEGMRRQARLLSALLAAVGSIALTVGGVGVMNVMLMGVSERRAEIGVRRALGARRRDIARQFGLEAVGLCTTGGVLGLAAGAATAYGVCLYAGWPPALSGEAAALGVGTAGALGLAFGIYPALQAAKLDPIVALNG